jgi:hypothetical protein
VAVRQRPPRGGRSVYGGEAGQRPVRGLEPRQDLGLCHHALGRPLGGAAHVHVLDEAHLGPARAGVLDQGHQLVVVGAAQHHRVHLERREAGRHRGVQAGQHPRQLVASGQRAEPRRVQRVQADGDAVQARAPQLCGLLGQQDAVGGERDVLEALDGHQLLDQAR